MKKFICLLSILSLFIPTTVFAARSVRVELNCMELEFDQPAIISENRTLVPLRKIFEGLGATVLWDDSSRTAIATKGERHVSITIGTNQLIVDDEIIELDVPAKIINNRTLVPLRAISEAFWCDVLWNDSESLVEIFDLTFINSTKSEYKSDNGINFTYFADSLLTKKSENELTVKSNDVSVTITKEPAEDIRIDDQYIEEIKKGLEEFSSLKTNLVRKTSAKNLFLIDCYNKGNSIYYMYANKNGFSYNLALTAPDGSNPEDLQKVMYVLKTFENNF